jgi:hypothetical protein
MPHGTGPVLRHALGRASPWQRYLISAAMVAGGVVLVMLGRVAGGLLAVAGVLLLVSMTRERLRRGRERQVSGPQGERP